MKILESLGKSLVLSAFTDVFDEIQLNMQGNLGITCVFSFLEGNYFNSPLVSTYSRRG